MSKLNSWKQQLRGVAQNSGLSLGAAFTLAAATESFLSSNSLVASVTNAAGLEYFDKPMTVIRGAEERIDLAAVENFVIGTIESMSGSTQNNRLDRTNPRIAAAIEAATLGVMGHLHSTNANFADAKGGVAGTECIALGSLFGNGGVNAVTNDIAAGESFGEGIDSVVTDVRLSISLTMLRVFKSLIDRILPRIATEETVVVTKIANGDVYDLAASQNPNADIRYSNAIRTPLIRLMRDPSFVDTTAKRVELFMENDDSTNPVLVHQNLVKVGVPFNMFKLGVSSNTVGYDNLNWTDIIGEGAYVREVWIAVTDGTTTEYIPVRTEYQAASRLVQRTNTNDSADREAAPRIQRVIPSTAVTAAGTASSLLSVLGDAGAEIDLNFTMKLNLKTGASTGYGSLNAQLFPAAGTTVADAVNTAYNKLSFSLFAFEPFAQYSEENMRKANISARVTQKEQSFYIPVSRMYTAEYSIKDTEGKSAEDIIKILNDIMSLGNDAKAVRMIGECLNNVYNRLKHEETDPLIDWYNSVAQDFLAGTLCNPNVWRGVLDVSNAVVMRETERNSDMHSLVMNRLNAIIADSQLTSLYLNQLNPGEKAVYRLVTTPTIIATLLAIKTYFNELNDTRVEEAPSADYSFYLPNGSRIDCVATSYKNFEGLMLIVPVRDADPESVISFGKNLDRGIFAGKFTFNNAMAVTQRAVANSREVVYPTNPIGMIISVKGLDAILKLMLSESIQVNNNPLVGNDGVLTSGVDGVGQALVNADAEIDETDPQA